MRVFSAERCVPEALESLLSLTVRPGRAGGGSHGALVVAARAGTLEEVVVDGQTGLLVEREDPSALADAITRLLARPDKAAALGERARVSALARFGWTAHVDAFDDLYRRLARLREPRWFEHGWARVSLGS